MCKLCDGTVRFLIARDPKRLFKFVALQSETARPLLAHFGISPEEALKSITFVDDGVAHRKSAAALQISYYLPMPYSFIYGFYYCVPRCLRDCVYDMVASNRYRVFGKYEDAEDAQVCLMPTKDVLSRFLDAHEMTKKKAKPAVSAAAAVAEGKSDAGVAEKGARGRGAVSTSAGVVASAASASAESKKDL